MVPSLFACYINGDGRFLYVYKKEIMGKIYNNTAIKHILALIRWGVNRDNELFKDEADMDNLYVKYYLAYLHEKWKDQKGKLD